LCRCVEDIGRYRSPCGVPAGCVANLIKEAGATKSEWSSPASRFCVRFCDISPFPSWPHLGYSPVQKRKASMWQHHLPLSTPVINIFPLTRLVAPEASHNAPLQDVGSEVAMRTFVYACDGSHFIASAATLQRATRTQPKGSDDLYSNRSNATFGWHRGPRAARDTSALRPSRAKNEKSQPSCVFTAETGSFYVHLFNN
jgi:hypothetical protein